MNKEKIYKKAETKAEKALCNIKCLCPEWKASGQCSSCDVLLGLREYYASRDIKDFDDYSWEEIAAIAECGDAANYFEVGDVKSATLYTGEVVDFVILAFNHDSISGNKKKVGITLGLKNLLDGEYEINEKYSNDGGWDKSKMRTVYMQRIFKLLPESLQSIIKTVDKQTGAGGGLQDIITSKDKLFLFSQTEVFGENDYTANGEGVQYDYFENDDNIIKTRGGSASYWWLRSPYAGGSGYFRSIHSSGVVANNYANYTYGVSFGFCI